MVIKGIYNDYKFTEIGPLPVDWDIVKVNEITLEHKQGFYSKESYSEKGTYLVRITDLQNPEIVFNQMPKLEIDKKTFEQFKVGKGDFIFARSGAIGRYGIVEASYPDAIFASYLIRFKFNSRIINNYFFGYFYESNLGISQLKSITQGSTNININANNIKSLLVPIPPLKEQERIVEILSTIDSKIKNTEQLMSKTMELKTGLMFHLLTKGIGHTEYKRTKLGELPASWNIKKMKEIGEFSKGKGIAKKDLSGTGLSCILYGELYTLYGENITNVVSRTMVNSDNSILGKINDVLIPSSGETAIDIATASSLQVNNVLIGGDINLFRPKEDVLGSYISYVINSVRKNELSKLAQGSSVFHLYASALNEFSLPVPSFNEQKKITEILTTIDNKIYGYKKEKEKYISLKKGLMQRLLTGQLRVEI